ncbi:MAG: adenylate/guanylate cyclase domain-containing protein [Alphaproteobacteria bacterium]
MRSRDARRRHLAVLFADVVGYSRLSELAEEATYRRLTALRSELLDPSFAAHGGRCVKTYGDGFLAVFDDAGAAVRCAILLQKEMDRREAAISSELRIAFRMGLNFCEVIVEADDIFGEGVNIAARLQAYADPGGIVMPAAICEQIGVRFDVAKIDLGDLHLRNISRPVRAVGLRIGTPPEPPAIIAGDKRASLAVLPFRGFPSGLGDDTYFAEGIVEDIVRGLGRLHELFVISHASTRRYAGIAADARAVADELGVRYVLRGSVRRDHGKLRIATELCDALSGAVLHADRYDGDASDLFALQDKIATRIVAAIAPQVRQWELRRVLRKPPDSWDAYDLMLQALDLLYRLDFASFSRARSLLQLAIENDLDYAAPYAYAAQWHIFRISQGWSPDPDADSKEAARLAGLAIGRDQLDPLALALHGHALSWFFKEYDGALVFLDRAINAGPSCAMAWTMNSLTHSYIGDGATAVARAEHALLLSPYDPHAFYYHTCLTIAHYTNGTFEEAVANGYRAVAQCPRFCAAMRILIVSLVALGRLAEARQVAGKLLDVQPNFGVEAYRPVCPFRDAEMAGLMADRLIIAGLPR